VSDVPAEDPFELLARTFLAASMAWGPGIAVHGERPGVRWGAAGTEIEGLNRLMFTTMNEATADADLQGALDVLDGFPVLSAWVPPDARPGDLVARLEGRGFLLDPHEGSVPAMAMDLRDAPRPVAMPGVSIIPVTTSDQLDQAARVMVEAFGAPPELASTFATLFAPAALTPDGVSRFFIALLEGKPAATAMGSVSDGALAIYNVGTVPEAQRRGLGRAVTLATMLDGVERGARAAVLETSEAGYGVYAKLGFAEVGRFRVLVRRREAPGT